MKKNQFAKLFLIILLSSSYIFAFAHFGSNVYETFATKSDLYSKGTMLGPIDLSGISQQQAITLVTKQVEEWQTSATIVLNYREKTLSMDSGIFTFQIEESILSAVDGVQNPLVVQINKEKLQQVVVILAPSVTVTEQLETDLLTLAQTLTNQKELNINQYLATTAEKEVLSTVRVEIDNMDPLMDKITEISIPAESTFSLNKYLKEQNVGELPAGLLNTISSSVYQLVLPTNFTIQERHIGMELVDGITLGYEAKIDSSLNWDFIFYNSNREDFTIKMSPKDGYVQLDLLGYPFVNKYEIELSNEQTFEPKTIKRYDPLLLPGETKEKASGKNGSYIEVYRKTLSQNGEYIGRELISKDFYAPQHRVEVVGLINNVVESENPVEGEIIDDSLVSESDNEQITEETIQEEVPTEADTDAEGTVVEETDQNK
ncbi:MAG TPA: G5 domain-containing protein [Pseudoneobacillus sp.]|nr:G5 domain-containing protein [Pseudoneobacillus sp.]